MMIAILSTIRAAVFIWAGLNTDGLLQGACSALAGVEVIGLVLLVCYDAEGL